AVEAVAGTGGRHRLAFEQAADDLEFGRVDVAAPLRECEGLVLLAAVTEPDAEDEAAVGDRVERRDVLSDLDRVEERGKEDAGADPHLAGLGRDMGEEGHRLEHLEGLGEEVLAAEDRGEAAVTREADLLKVLCERPA